MTTRSTLRCTTLAVEGAAHPAGSGLPILHGIDAPTPGSEDFDTLWHTLHPDRPVPAAYDFRMS